MLSTDGPFVRQPVQEDDRYEVRGSIVNGYIRVHRDDEKFFIPANLFRRAAFRLRPDEDIKGRSITITRLPDADNGAKRFRFEIMTRDGERKDVEISGSLVDEIVMRIVQVQATLFTYGYDDPDASAPYDDEDAQQVAAAV